MEKGVLKGKHPFHIVSLSYKGHYAETCSVVLQGVDPEKALLRFHTHTGASKVAAFHQDPRISIMVYAPELKLQVRFRGVVDMHHKDAFTESVWHEMRESSKQCYQLPAPGAVLGPKVLQVNLQQASASGYESFMVCWLRCEEIDVLELHHEGHERMLHQLKQGKWMTQKIQA
jgi:pyridoxine/pyridoxamine 5'-phosphate oxidase